MKASGPSGNSAASALRSERSWSRKSRQPSQERTCLRAGPVALREPLGRLGELDLDLLAGQQPRLARLGEGDPGAARAGT